MTCLIPSKKTLLIIKLNNLLHYNKSMMHVMLIIIIIIIIIYIREREREREKERTH
jgi:hypothetical protein